MGRSWERVLACLPAAGMPRKWPNIRGSCVKKQFKYEDCGGAVESQFDGRDQWALACRLKKCCDCLNLSESALSAPSPLLSICGFRASPQDAVASLRGQVRVFPLKFFCHFYKTDIVLSLLRLLSHRGVLAAPSHIHCEKEKIFTSNFKTVAKKDLKNLRWFAFLKYDFTCTGGI